MSGQPLAASIDRSGHVAEPALHLNLGLIDALSDHRVYVPLERLRIADPDQIESMDISCECVTFELAEYLTRDRSWQPALRVEIVLAIALILLGLVSSQTGINKHFRYALPAMPLLFVLCARLWNLKAARNRAWLRTLLWLLLCLGMVESLWTAPHHISFFNAAVGGPQQGRFHLLNSNVSWGQDVLRLIRWQREQPDRRTPLFAALHANYDPSVLGLEYSASPRKVERNGTCGPEPGWYAIDVNFLMGHSYAVAGKDGGAQPASPDFWAQFQQRQPIDQIGYSIFIYRVE